MRSRSPLTTSAIWGREQLNEPHGEAGHLFAFINRFLHQAFHRGGDIIVEQSKDSAAGGRSPAGVRLAREAGEDVQKVTKWVQPSIKAFDLKISLTLPGTLSLPKNIRNRALEPVTKLLQGIQRHILLPQF